MEFINRYTAWGHHRFTGVVARVLMATIFIIIGGLKVLNLSSTAKFIAVALGLADPSLLSDATASAPILALLITVIAVVLEFGGGVLLLIGFKKRLAITMLAFFTIVVTALFHIKGGVQNVIVNLFVTPDLPVDQTQLVMFLKNLAILGGLLALYKACGCGHADCATCGDGKCSKCEVKG
ncbi:DoxX family protein [Candidatus Parcubacteria bacterium]|nr:DoxX family protein [Candidatus Parcubacteria bacterium]